MPLSPIIPLVDIQSYLQHAGHLPSYLALTGTPGPATDAAIFSLLTELKTHNVVPADFPSWSPQRKLAAATQVVLAKTTKYDLGSIDGLIGTRTLYALELYHNAQRDIKLAPNILNALPSASVTTSPAKSQLTLVSFPKQSAVRPWLGEPGNPDCTAKFRPPFPFRMDGSLSDTASIPLGAPSAPTPIRTIAVHSKLHDSLTSIYTDILNTYGSIKIHELGLDQYAGSFNYRPMRGGKTLSMHSWGAAIDHDAQRNTLHETHLTARFARPAYRDFIDIWYSHGWINLGRERDYDWMHFQAPRLG